MPFAWWRRLTAAGDARARWLREGLEAHAQGRFVEARSAFARVLVADPRDTDARFLTGLCHQAEGDHARAVSVLEALRTEQPGHGDAVFALASSLRALGRTAQALEAYETAVTLSPGDAAWLNDHGTALLDAGRLDSALAALGEAARLSEGRWDIHYNLGNALQAAGRWEEARGAFERALALEPAAIPVRNNLGSCLHALGRHAEAAACFSELLREQPDSVDLRNNLGAALQGGGAPDVAVDQFRQALALDPRHAGAQSNLAQALQELGYDEEARGAFEQLHRLTGEDSALVCRATVLPVIPASARAIADARGRLARELSELMNRPLEIPHPERTLAYTGFHLAYHGEDDRPLLEQLARLHLHACPSLGWVAPHVEAWRGPGARIRVGFLSRFLHAHSIGKTSRGLIERLDRRRFEVIAIHVPPVTDDTVARGIRAAADGNVDLPADLAQARQVLAALRLDVLFFQEIGLDPYSRFLAFARTAPVQCVSFGHPNTTGIPHMDWWISSANFEPEGATAHYSERLWLAQGLGTLAYYHRPAVPRARLGRAELGLPEGRALHFCPHTLFRMHPDFDALLAGVLEADSAAELVFLEGRQPAWLRRYLNRLAAAVGAGAMRRVRVLPAQPHERFLQIMAVVDSVLDPVGFNGMNNSLDAFAAGTPVVTLPHRFQRGRHTTGMYRRMDWMDCVARDADDYVRIATALGRDRDYAAAARAQIAARSHLLFEDQAVVHEFERFFEESVGG